MENTPSPRPSPKKVRDGSPADSDGYNSTEEKGKRVQDEEAQNLGTIQSSASF